MTSLRIAVRSMVRRPLPNLAALITLGGGMAAVAVVAALFSAVLFPAPAYRDPANITVLMASVRPGAIEPADYLMHDHAQVWQTSPPRSLQNVAAIGFSNAVMRANGTTQRVSIAVVSGSFFDVLGTEAARGRVLIAEDGWSAAAPAAFISERAWRKHFQADPRIAGRTVDLDGVMHTVVGVARTEFDYPRGTDVWIPEAHVPTSKLPVPWSLVGRLRPGMSFQEAQAEVIARSRAEFGDTAKYGQGVTAVQLSALERSASQGGLLPVVAISIGALYLVAALNLGVLLLLQLTARARELAVRAALGAGVWGAVRPFLLELAIQLGLGGLLAISGAVLAVRYVRAHFLFDTAPLTQRAELIALASVAVLAIASGALLVMIVRGRTRAVDLFGVLRRSGETITPDSGARRARRWFVALEVSLAVMLACAAGVIAKSLMRFRGVDAGFDIEKVVIARPNYDAAGYDEARELALAADVQQQVRAIRGVSEATFWRRVPLEYPPPRPEKRIGFQDQKDALDNGEKLYWFYEVGPRFFQTLGLRLVEGRTFDEHDDRGAAPVAIINRKAAELWWPGRSALGKQLNLNPGNPSGWMTVVGVVENTALDGFDRAVVARGGYRLELFRPINQGGAAQAPGWLWKRSCGYCAKLVLGARASGNVDRVGRALDHALQSSAPALPVDRATTMFNEQLGPVWYAGPVLARYVKTIGGFAGAALLLALLGIYAVVAETMRSRNRELAIRLALGASPGALLRMMLRENALLCAVSVLCGTVLYVNLVRVAGGFLFGGKYQPLLFKQSPFDTHVISVTAVTALGVVAIAVLIASRSALAIDPREGLHAE